MQGNTSIAVERDLPLTMITKKFSGEYWEEECENRLQAVAQDGL